MQINKVEICGVNTSELPVLKNNQMMELLLKIKEGDEEARQEFVRGNLRLVLSVIQKFNNRGENIDDLFQIGCIGLIKAIDNFDLSQNVRFSTYAVPMIIGEIRRYLRDNNPIRVSRSLKDIAYKALQVRERLVRNNAKEPTVSEIAKELELEVEDVVMALDAIQDPISLFDPVYQDNGDAIFVMDQVQDKKDTDENWLQEIALKEAFRESLAALGGHLDILVTAHGVQSRHPSEEFPMEDWKRVLDVNLTAVFELCQLAAKQFMAQESKGKIITVASMLSFFGGYTVPAYAASKGGVAQITKAFCNEWAEKGINVNSIAPGYMATEMNTALLDPKNPRKEAITNRIPAKRWGTAEDMKGPCVFLASDASDYLNGAVIPVDGGYLVR